MTVMAAGFLRTLSGGAVEVRSAGSAPGDDELGMPAVG